jgi:hypothetical protein
VAKLITLNQLVMKQKTYIVIIGSESFQVGAQNLSEAKQTAQFNKNRMGLKGRTIVRLNK